MFCFLACQHKELDLLTTVSSNRLQQRHYRMSLRRVCGCFFVLFCISPVTLKLRYGVLRHLLSPLEILQSVVFVCLLVGWFVDRFVHYSVCLLMSVGAEYLENSWK